jgi:uncharacterized membrane protein (UPF0127 family)
MRFLHLTIVGLLVIVSIGGIYYYQHNHPTIGVSRLAPTQKVSVANHLFQIAVATTTAQQIKGLDGITSLSADQGMYFPLTGQTGVSFWMKGMIIPIDILWIKQGAIIGLNPNLSPPAPGTPDNQLVLYNSPDPHPDAVLEIAANQSHRLDLKVGDLVKRLPSNPP